MKYLDEIELVDISLEVLREDKRMSVDTSDLASVSSTLYTLVNRLGADMSLGMISTYVTDIHNSIELVKKVNYTKMDNNMRNAIISGLLKLKAEIAILAYDYYTTNEFEVTEANLPILRQIVKIKQSH